MNGQGAISDSRPWAVLDTNTVLDMLVFDDAAARPLRSAIVDRRLRWVGCRRMLEELHGVLQRPRMGRWSPTTAAQAAREFAASWMDLEQTPTAFAAPRCRDAADQVFIDLAWTISAKWLLTRDKALLALARHARGRGLRVCTAAAWAAGDVPALPPATAGLTGSPSPLGAAV